MNLETKITIYKFTPQLFTLTPYLCSTDSENRCCIVPLYSSFGEAGVFNKNAKVLL